jgi:Selenocysteine synthase [seryl-tRNASer selenium transferase]
MLGIDDFVQVARQHNLPLIVDAAAEEDLRQWVASGADMVIYSGAKAFNAPTSGFISGKRNWIAACKAQHYGIARAMKIRQREYGRSRLRAGPLPDGGTGARRRRAASIRRGDLRATRPARRYRAG